MTDTDTIIIPEDQEPDSEGFDTAKTATQKASGQKKKSTTKKRAPSASSTSRRKTSSKKYKKTGIPGLSVRFNWKEFLGINKLRRKFTKKTGIPTTQAGIERKIGEKIADWLKGFFTKEKK